MTSAALGDAREIAVHGLSVRAQRLTSHARRSATLSISDGGNLTMKPQSCRYQPSTGPLQSRVDIPTRLPLGQALGASDRVVRSGALPHHIDQRRPASLAQPDAVVAARRQKIG